MQNNKQTNPDAEGEEKLPQFSKMRYNGQLIRTEEVIINDPSGYEVKRLSNMARMINDFVTIGKKKDTIWSFTAVDITEAKQRIKEYKERTGNKLSFTAFIIAVFARVVANHKNPINSMLKNRKDLYVFNDVDVSTNIERVLPDGMKKPVSYTVRKANEKTLFEISEELERAKYQKKITVSSGKKKRWIKHIIKNIPNYPRPIRMMFLRRMVKSPTLKKKSMGTVNVTAVGMFGSGLGYMIQLTPHTISLGVGGTEIVPYNVDGKIVNRYLSGLTLAIDHSVVDGGPAARFFHDLRQWYMKFCYDADWCFKSLPQ